MFDGSHLSRRRQITHGQGLIDIQLVQGHRLSWGEVELGGGGPQMAMHALHRNAHEHAPHLIGQPRIGPRLGNTTVHVRIVVNDLVESLVLQQLIISTIELNYG